MAIFSFFKKKKNPPAATSDKSGTEQLSVSENPQQPDALKNTATTATQEVLPAAGAKTIMPAETADSTADSSAVRQLTDTSAPKSEVSEAAQPSSASLPDAITAELSQSTTAAEPPANDAIKPAAAAEPPADKASKPAAAAESSASTAADTESAKTENADAAILAVPPAEPEVKSKPDKPHEPARTSVSFFDRLKRTRDNLAMGLSALISGRKISEDLYEELETALLTSDLGVATTSTIIERLRHESKLHDLRDASALKDNLRRLLTDIVTPCAVPLQIDQNRKPYVIMMVGVNGSGKTTTLGKLAAKYSAQGLKVMMAAGDTFRAAAVEQLKQWGERTGVPVISQPTGSDSASVLYDALTAARARNADVLLCDTAGRLQNKDNLMEELKKIIRVMKKLDESAPDEIMLVLDAATGQNAVSQLKIFSEAVKITGLCLTKLDGTAKGGVVISLAEQYKLPLRWIGMGEGVEDLCTFNAKAFVDAIVI